MSGIEFEWEPRKAASNRAKHKVSFEEAATAFEEGLNKDYYAKRI